MPRIVQVISTREGLGGAERILAALLHRGQEEGWDQRVLNPFAATSAGSALAGLVPGIAYEAFPATRLRDLPRVRRWLLGQLNEADPDLVHVHLFHGLVLTGSLPRGRYRRLLTHHHGDFLRSQGRLAEAALDRHMGRRFDRVVAVSDAARTFLINEYGYAPEKVLTIRNGWVGPPREETMQADEPTIVCVANLRPEKGHGILLQAFSGVIKDIPDAQLVLIGDGPLRDRLEAETRRLGLARNVQFIGPVGSIWSYLARAHVFAFPSLSEQLGMAVMEAMAAGLPVVASDVGGLPELVTEGVTGSLVAPGDVEMLRTRLVDLLRDPATRERMGKQARVAADAFRMVNTVDRYMSLYTTMLSRDPEGPHD